MDISHFKAVDEAVETPEWVGDLPYLDPNFRVLVHSFVCPRVARCEGHAYRSASKEDLDENGKFSQGFIERADREVLIEGVLVGWSGLMDGEKEVPFSSERSREFMQSPTFENAVRIAANRVTVIQKAKVAKVVGKYQPSSTKTEGDKVGNATKTSKTSIKPSST